MNYLQKGELGAVSVNDNEYEVARDKALELVPEGAEAISIQVDRER